MYTHFAVDNRTLVFNYLVEAPIREEYVSDILCVHEHYDDEYLSLVESIERDIPKKYGIQGHIQLVFDWSVFSNNRHGTKLYSFEVTCHDAGELSSEALVKLLLYDALVVLSEKFHYQIPPQALFEYDTHLVDEVENLRTEVNEVKVDQEIESIKEYLEKVAKYPEYLDVEKVECHAIEGDWVAAIGLMETALNNNPDHEHGWLVERALSCAENAFKIQCILDSKSED